MNRRELCANVENHSPMIENIQVDYFKFIDWIGVLPESTTFPAGSVSHCPFGCFLRHVGFTGINVGDKKFCADQIQVPLNIPQRINSLISFNREYSLYLNKTEILRRAAEDEEKLNKHRVQING